MISKPSEWIRLSSLTAVKSSKKLFPLSVAVHNYPQYGSQHPFQPQCSGTAVSQSNLRKKKKLNSFRLIRICFSKLHQGVTAVRVSAQEAAKPDRGKMAKSSKKILTLPLTGLRHFIRLQLCHKPGNIIPNQNAN